MKFLEVLKILAVLSIIFLGLILTGVFITKLTVTDIGGLDQTEVEQAKLFVDAHIDHPIQNGLLRLGKLAITDKNNGALYVTAYTLWRIPFIRLKVSGEAIEPVF